MRTLFHSRRCIHEIFLILLINLSCLRLQATTIYYVKPGGTGAGTSWATAMGTTQLQAAINAAAAAGGGQVWVAAGTYIPNAWPVGSTTTTTNRDWAFNLVNGVAVYGGFAGSETTLSQRNYTTNVTILSGDINTAGTYTDDCYHVILSINNDNTAVLDGFTIQYGYAYGGTSYLTYSGVQVIRNFGGGIVTWTSQPTINNCTFQSNTGSSGGAVYNNNTTAPPLFTNCSFSGNAALTTTATDGGGAICNANATLISLTSCSFSNNTSASDGGGIFSNNSCNMTIVGCTFTSNTAAGSGGGFVNESSSIAALTNCTFSGNRANSATVGGGAICNYSTNGFSASGCTFSNNNAVYFGGGIYFTSGSSQSTMNTCTFSSNNATYGGGIAAGNGSNQTITTTSFTSNVATYGGGVYNNGSSFSYSSCTFQSNSASAATGMAGGGECNDNNSNGSMLHCLFLNNVSTGDGAGQYNNSSNAVDSECVFNGNVAGGNGGGMVDNGGNPKSYNCVLTDNVASGYGGGFYNITANATFENNTVYNNSANSAGGYGDGIYVASGSPKIYNDIVWSRSNSASIGLVYATGVTPKVQYSDTQGATFSGTGNISVAPSFYNSGNYMGVDNTWATSDDGLHLVTGSAGASVIPVASATSYDITMATRPSPGPLSDMGAYEGAGGFVALLTQIVSLSATPATGHTIALDWQVTDATALADFQILRSADGSTFQSIGATPAFSGQDSYHFTDANPIPGVNYYRLQLDARDAVTTQSSIVVTTLSSGDNGLTLRPTGPTTGQRWLTIHALRPAALHLSVLDAAGRPCWTYNTTVAAGDNILSLKIPSLPHGVYFLSATIEGSPATAIPFSD